MLGFPRIRGDVPHTAPIRWVLPEFSPHTRGCSGIIDDFKVTPKVFPAYAGMFLRAGLWISLPASFPRIRGDVPIGVYISPQRARFSPHTRGCSATLDQDLGYAIVFPAYAGMFLGASPTAVGKWSFPRIRGDVPTEDGKHVLSGEFSPHTRGCSSGHQAGNAPGCVFPAYAGMFPHKHSKNASTRRFPRIRGDVPPLVWAAATSAAFSPHTRGCSQGKDLMQAVRAVFPAYAGMFLAYSCPRNPGGCFPRIRGDVPRNSTISLASTPFSPHTRGCSALLAVRGPANSVFPAYAGMFLCCFCSRHQAPRFPRIRGDVPCMVWIRRVCLGFSPHTRGCSYQEAEAKGAKVVFPAYAGMFLALGCG